MSKKIDVPALIKRGYVLKDEIEVRQTELKEINVTLLEAGGGEHPDGRKVIVIESKPSIVTPESIEDAQAIVGEHFGKLFERVVTYKPVKSFEAVAGALLTKAKAAKLITLCQKVKAAFLKWS